MKTPWSFVGKDLMRKTLPHSVFDSYMKKEKLKDEGIVKNMTPNDDMGL